MKIERLEMLEKSINDAGYLFIEKWVTENSIYGKPDQRAMEVWCQDAENGRFEDSAIIEMCQFNTVSGHTETLMIPIEYFRVYDCTD